MASETIDRARVIPGLGPRAVIGIGDRDRLAKAVVKQIRVTIVRTPSVGDAIDRSIRVSHQQAGLQPAFWSIWIAVVRHQIEVFDEDRSRGESPLTRRRKSDLFVRSKRRTAVGNGHPPRFDS